MTLPVEKARAFQQHEQGGTVAGVPTIWTCAFVALLVFTELIMKRLNSFLPFSLALRLGIDPVVIKSSDKNVIRAQCSVLL